MSVLGYFKAWWPGVGYLASRKRFAHVIGAGIPCFIGLGLDEGHVPTIWLLL